MAVCDLIDTLGADSNPDGMKYTLHITKNQADHLGEPLPVQEFVDRFDTPEQAADYARVIIAEHTAPVGAYSFDVLDSDGNPVHGFAGLEE